MSRGRSVSQMASRSSSVGFPSRGGKVSYASLKRRVMASGVIVVGFYSRTRIVRKVLANWRKLEGNLLGSSFLGYSRPGAVENRDDDDQSDCIGKAS